MAVKNYMINDKWLDIAKQNIVEVESTDGVIVSVKVNGQEYGGGGGSSDLSTAQVTIVNTNTNDVEIYMPVQFDDEEEDYSALMPQAYVVGGETLTVTTVLYKGIVVADLRWSEDFNVSVSGSAEYHSPNFDITGDCTITIS